jgi:27-O-demethylrifamycin SV methyltransferase
MVEAVRIEPGQRVLDVGCGNGAQACRLVAEHDVTVLGITTSQVGIDLATARADAAGIADRATFELRDGTDNRLPAASFDRIWVLESSHLMRDRDRLITECARVVRPGGRLALCDIVRKREIPFSELRARRSEFQTLRAAFGDAHMQPLELYAENLEKAGLAVDVTADLSDPTLLTFDRWRANADRYSDEVTAALGGQGLDEFRRSCDILESLWRDGTFGYGLIAAQRPA